MAESIYLPETARSGHENRNLLADFCGFVADTHKGYNTKFEELGDVLVKHLVPQRYAMTNPLSATEFDTGTLLTGHTDLSVLVDGRFQSQRLPGQLPDQLQPNEVVTYSAFSLKGSAVQLNLDRSPKMPKVCEMICEHWDVVRVHPNIFSETTSFTQDTSRCGFFEDGTWALKVDVGKRGFNDAQLMFREYMMGNFGVEIKLPEIEDTRRDMKLLGFFDDRSLPPEVRLSDIRQHTISGLAAMYQQGLWKEGLEKELLNEAKNFVNNNSPSDGSNPQDTLKYFFTGRINNGNEFEYLGLRNLVREQASIRVLEIERFSTGLRKNLKEVLRTPQLSTTVITSDVISRIIEEI